ncbi:MAG: UTP--glucose-1-phosphate uridylyltransferase GalU [Acidobacteriota bacterium]|nr:UTP--glucose-1-phosphate uridylyltransferase GalU [Acidobacteriota bacterium]
MRIRKAVIPAAGLGTRFLPATKAQPKEMLPLVDKPLIQYVVEEAVASGIDQVIIVTGRGKGAIEDHFDVAYELERTLEERGKSDLLRQVRAPSNLATVSFVRQKQALGLGHAVLTARHLVGDEPFAVLLGDDIIDAPTPCVGQMMEVFERYGTSVLATQAVHGPAISQYGVIEEEAVAGAAESDVFKVLDLVEKPSFEQAPSNLAIIGRYLLTPEIFEVLGRTAPDRGGEIQLTHGLRGLLDSQAIHALRFEGKRYDAGDKLGFLEATVEFALKREDLGKRFAEYLSQLRAESGAEAGESGFAPAVGKKRFAPPEPAGRGKA